MPVRIVELLLKGKRITPDQLQEALSHQREHGGPLAANLVKLGHVKDEEITSLLSKQYGVPSIALDQFEIAQSVIRLVPGDTARKYQIVPLGRAGATLSIAMTDPTNVFAMDDVKFMTGCNVEPVVASEAAVLDSIDRYYGAGLPPPATVLGQPASESALEVAARALEMPVLTDAGRVEVIDDLEEISAETLARQGDEAPVIKLVNVSEPDKDGRRTITFELNGMTREAHILDRSVAPKAKPRAKADTNDPLQVAAPIPGLIVALSASVGHKVAKGDKLVMLEAMKMQTTVYAPVDGVVAELPVQLGDTVESKDLLVRLKA